MRVRDLFVVFATMLIPLVAWSAEPSSAELFLKLVPVFSHPRCANCHPSDPFPRQGDDQHRHLFGIVRGPEDRGAAGAHCTNCHGDKNNPASGVPGAPDWHLAPLKMAWVGLPPAELCKVLTDPARGAMPTEQLIAHLETGLVRWAFEPGSDPHGVSRSKPPMEYQKFLEFARAWSASGAACPRQ
jgi:hypothetical protein